MTFDGPWGPSGWQREAGLRVKRRPAVDLKTVECPFSGSQNHAPEIAVFFHFKWNGEGFGVGPGAALQHHGNG